MQVAGEVVTARRLVEEGHFWDGPRSKLEAPSRHSSHTARSEPLFLPAPSVIDMSFSIVHCSCCHGEPPCLCLNLWLRSSFRHDGLGTGVCQDCQDRGVSVRIVNPPPTYSPIPALIVHVVMLPASAERSAAHADGLAPSWQYASHFHRDSSQYDKLPPLLPFVPPPFRSGVMPSQGVPPDGAREKPCITAVSLPCQERGVISSLARMQPSAVPMFQASSRWFLNFPLAGFSQHCYFPQQLVPACSKEGSP